MEARDLAVRFDAARAVDGVTLDWRRGEVLGVVGESGCGKSTLARALLGLVPPAAGDIRLDGEPVAGRGQVRELRRRVQMIFQDPYQTLNPRMRVSAIVAEPLRIRGVPRSEHAGRVAAALADVGLGEHLLDRHPHQLSGGQRQRAMIALALACRPALVIADEPTTALDVVMQAQILQLLERLREELGLALILISHDLAVLAETCDRIAVMYAGRIVETGPVASVFSSPQHPYTKRLLDSLPVIGGPRALAAPIGGRPPEPGAMPEGCRFAPRCPYAQDRCREDPALREVGPGQAAACHFAPWEDWPAVEAVA
jgi:oligopeptide/dipeptide ABC transporter ATP-binding protein